MQDENEVLNSNELLNSAVGVHDALRTWISTQLAVLEATGTNREEASLQMYAVHSKLEELTNNCPPPIISLAVTYMLRNDLEHLSKDQRLSVTSAAPLAILEAIGGIEKGLITILKETGWQMEQVLAQMSSIVEKVYAVDSEAMIRHLTVAVALDKYVEHLISKTMLPFDASSIGSHSSKAGDPPIDRIPAAQIEPTTAAQLHALLVRVGAPEEITEWVGKKSLAEMWAECPRADWMLWLCEKLLGKPGWPTRAQIVCAACACAETVLSVYEKECPESGAPRMALEIGKAWVQGKATLQDVRGAHSVHINDKVFSNALLVSLLPSVSAPARYAAKAAYHAVAAADPLVENAAAVAATAAINSSLTAMSSFDRLVRSRRLDYTAKAQKRLAGLVRKELSGSAF